MKILEDKGFLKSQKTEKTHVFTPNLSRERYEMISLRHVTEKVFQGNPSSLVMRLLNDAELAGGWVWDWFRIYSRRPMKRSISAFSEFLKGRPSGGISLLSIMNPIARKFCRVSVPRAKAPPS